MLSNVGADPDNHVPWYRRSLWYAVETLPLAEERARRSLSHARFGVYLPKRRVEKFNSRKREWVTRERMLMPGYVLVEFQPTPETEWVSRDDRASWRRLHACDGVRRALGAYDPDGDIHPFPIPAALVERIMAGQLNLEFDDTREARRRWERSIHDRYPVGGMVAVKDGPFASFQGEIASVNGKAVLNVLVSMMGRLVPVELEGGQVEVLRAAA